MEKYEKWPHFVRMRSGDHVHLGDANMSKKGTSLRRILTFLLIAVDRNGFHRVKEEGQIYKTLPQIFKFLPWDLVMIFQSLVMILPRFFRLWKTITKSLGKN